MAYHFTAETTARPDTALLRRRLTQYSLIEFFPVEVSENGLILGISIPFRSTDTAALEAELLDLMTYLIVHEAFEVTDLFRGQRVGPGDLTDLAHHVLT